MRLYRRLVRLPLYTFSVGYLPIQLEKLVFHASDLLLIVQETSISEVAEFAVDRYVD